MKEQTLSSGLHSCPPSKLAFSRCSALPTCPSWPSVPFFLPELHASEFTKQKRPLNTAPQLPRPRSETGVSVHVRGTICKWGVCLLRKTLVRNKTELRPETKYYLYSTNVELCAKPCSRCWPRSSEENRAIFGHSHRPGIKEFTREEIKMQ